MKTYKTMPGAAIHFAYEVVEVWTCCSPGATAFCRDCKLWGAVIGSRRTGLRLLH